MFGKPLTSYKTNAMILNFFEPKPYLDESFGVAEGRGNDLHAVIKETHDRMIENTMLNKVPFDKSKLILDVLRTCNTINEEAYALYLIGLKISRLQRKLSLLSNPLIKAILKMPE